MGNLATAAASVYFLQKSKLFSIFEEHFFYSYHFLIGTAKSRWRSRESGGEQPTSTSRSRRLTSGSDGEVGRLIEGLPGNV